MSDQRRSRVLIWSGILLGIIALGGGISLYLWLASPALDDRLIGAWHGEGKSRYYPPHGQGVPASAGVPTTMTVRAEFRRDGTYAWDERHSASAPAFLEAYETRAELDKRPARWQVTRAHGDRLTVSLGGMNPVVLTITLQGPDTFKLTSKGPSQSVVFDSITFHRSVGEN
jgi:hypothetical protein